TEICLQKNNEVTGISRTNALQQPNFSHIAADLSISENLLNFKFPNINKACERIVLINNAAQITPVKYCGEADNKAIAGALTLNLIAPVVLSNIFIATFENHSAEKIIINISSGAANYPVDGWSVYCSSKAALDMFSRTIAMEREKRKSGFKIASIAPGIVDTHMQSAIRQTNAADFSRIEDFINYKNQNQLQTPEAAAEKIYSAINRLNSIQDVVFSIKN
ncbi:MAG: SDR family NAD(P)-dependent oxidoreductase, partial [Sphingobacteriales bacterium]